MDVSRIDTALASRAITFENPTGARGAGGASHGGRKGSPSRTIAAGERVTLADIVGQGRVRHVWVTIPPAKPEVMRAQLLEGWYDGAAEPSISVPLLDFFGLAQGRPVPYASALTSAQEGRGFNSYMPMPFREGLRLEYVNGADRPIELYYQVDYTLEELGPEEGYLHVSFRRENPTTMERDFVIADGLVGPGRFLGCVVGIRVLDGGVWYGEGEVKVFLDGDGELPTICGTGLEDYVGTAWGMGAHHAPYAGSPLEVRRERAPQPDHVGFYRWHIADPIVFQREMKVTIQQIGYGFFAAGQDAEFEAFAATHPAAGRGWDRSGAGGVVARGIFERVDDYCAAAFVYCASPQRVQRVDLAAGTVDLERLDYERPSPMERLFNA